MLAGFGTGLSLIAAIGAQNAFVLRQGLRREHVPAVVVFCVLADLVLVLPVFAAREDDAAAASVSRELVERIEARDSETRCCFVPSLDHLVATLDDETRPGDVLITMGAGDIDRVRHEFTR